MDEVTLKDLAIQEAELDASGAPGAQVERLPLFAPVDLSGLATATVTPTRYAVEWIIPRKHVTLLGGHGGMGKSVLALALAAHVVCGRDWGALPCAKQRALYVSLEDAGDVVRHRLSNIARAYALPMDWIEQALDVRDGTRGDTTLAVEVSEQGSRRLAPTPALSELRELVALQEYGIVVIDNASDAFAGDENNRRQVRTFVRWLASIARSEDCAVLLLAHVDKHAARHGSNGNSYSGSTSWHNSARSRLALIDQDGTPWLIHEKANLGKLAAPVPLAFNDRGILMPAAQRSPQAKADDSRIVLEAVTQALGMGETIPAVMSGPRQAFHALEAHLPEDLARDRDAKRRVHGAVLAMLKEGTLVKEAFTTAQRKQKFRIALAQATPIQGAA